jgi:hypothetical protein
LILAFPYDLFPGSHIIRTYSAVHSILERGSRVKSKGKKKRASVGSAAPKERKGVDKIDKDIPRFDPSVA